MATEYPYIQSISISNWSNSSNVTGSCSIAQSLGMTTSITLDSDKCNRIFALLFDMIEEDVKKAGMAMQALKRPPALEAPKTTIETDFEARPFPGDDLPF